MLNSPDAAPTAPLKLRMTAQERRASFTLALLFAVRMLGLFLLTPVFAVAAQTLNNGDNATLVGIALGAYGLTQALLQIPLGMASDRWGRRPVIVLGLLLFIAGGVVCALSTSVNGIIVGRTLQGLGAVSAAITAWVADATRPQVRTRAMALTGGSIGVAFAASLVLAPVLVGAVGLSGLFWVMSALGLICLGLACFVVPQVSMLPRRSNAMPARARDALCHPTLLRLNLGVFCLHFMVIALFILVPSQLLRLGHYTPGQLWQVYLPVIVLSFVLMVPVMLRTEARAAHVTTLRWAVVALIGILALMPLAHTSFFGLCALLVAFFVAFNLLEAMQPALVSSVAPADVKGLALGVFNTAQSLGVFAGGVAGGLSASHSHANVGFAVCAGVALLWRVVIGASSEVRMGQNPPTPS